MSWRFFWYVVFVVSLLTVIFSGAGYAVDLQLPAASDFMHTEVISQVTPEVAKFVAALGAIYAFTMIMFR